MDVRELLKREIGAEEIEAVREPWKQHSIAEENRDLPGLWDPEQRLFRGEKVYVDAPRLRGDEGGAMEGYEHRTEDEVLAEQEVDAVDDLEHVTPEEQRRRDDPDADR